MFSDTVNNNDIFTFIIIFCVEILMGILENGLIAVVNIMDWAKRRRMSSVDQILTALALIRLIYVWSVVTGILLFISCPRLLMSSKMLTAVGIIWIVNNHFSIWLSTCLGVFYFLKIANFSNSFFLYLKWRVKKVILMVILVSTIFLIFNVLSLSLYHHFSIEIYEGNMSYSLRNSPQLPRIFLFTNTSKFLIINSSHVYLPINSLFTLLPFTVSLVAFLMLMFSLWKHHKKMQVNVKQTRDASIMAHMKALQTVLFLLLLYAIYLLFNFIDILSRGLMGGKSTILFEHISVVLFPISHSFVLILGNSKLRQATLSVLACLSCQTKDMDTMGSK
ncbi:taste receptor type 2 member 110-like [Apodemus sylvaticus]|uniref:taste receptor type 2 member 110-like n=1 Tax=Apodemus sylvaticus TaxID=10129 RepID=UPI0022434C7C|nr:taste receptor type 2 member 110-like [Apodemus sylvaticus]